MASGDPNPKKPAANLLRHALASSGSAPDAGMDACPDPEILAAYVERALDADESAHYELHFAQCAICREQLAAMARASAPAPRPPRIGWIWNWGWIALAPVTAVLLIAAILIARRPATNYTSVVQQPPLVAMSRSSQPTLDTATSPSGASPELFAPKASKPNMAPVTRTNSDVAPAAKPAPATPSPADVTAAVRSESAPAEVTTAPAEGDLKGRSITDLPMNGRNYTSLRELSSSPAPAAPPPGKGAANRSRTQVPAQTQTVVVQSSEEDATTLASTQDSLSNNSAAGIAGAAPAARNKGATYSALTAGVANQMVSVAPLDKAAPLLVQSPDPQVLWRISGGRYLERSTDSGATWRTQWTNATAHVVAGSAPSADTCWLVGSGGIVLLATDARNWHTVTPPEVDDFTAVSASDAESATITTKDGRQFKTRDGGKHWSPAP